MARKRSYEQQATDLDAQIRRLQERRRQALAKHGEEERRALEHARYTIGSLVLERFDGWKEIDLWRLEVVLEKNARVFESCVTDALPVSEAMARMRGWEREHRERLSSVSAEEGDRDEDTRQE